MDLAQRLDTPTPVASLNSQAIREPRPTKIGRPRPTKKWASALQASKNTSVAVDGREYALYSVTHLWDYGSVATKMEHTKQKSQRRQR